ncbi:hypothetical protein MF406_00835 [Georgenia sp. TF02-10]|uniref:hypothetical protein n=1 Tax=Georgenia sp. TF02-10 TaxID=2917725 RepID=UPI001FA6BBA5|nr:hypothetical protein [Georgenia sp. TF02-10]UNX54879.1 hypothetical protein MF406_00835 [Georgenia sp. TF02-10]
MAEPSSTAPEPGAHSSTQPTGRAGGTGPTGRADGMDPAGRAGATEPTGRTDGGEPTERAGSSRPLPGIRLVIGGVIVAVLAPLFGFLGGSMAGTSGTGDLADPVYLFLVGGIVIGGVGAVVAIVSGLRLARALSTRPARAPDDAPGPLAG